MYCHLIITCINASLRRIKNECTILKLANALSLSKPKYVVKKHCWCIGCCKLTSLNNHLPSLAS